MAIDRRRLFKDYMGINIESTIKNGRMQKKDLTIKEIQLALNELDKMGVDYRVGGSLGLILNGIIPNRPISDLNLEVDDLSKIDKNPNKDVPSESVDASLELWGVNIDVWVTERGNVTTKDFHGWPLKVADPTHALKAKIEYGFNKNLSKEKRLKHLNDLKSAIEYAINSISPYPFVSDNEPQSVGG